MAWIWIPARATGLWNRDPRKLPERVNTENERTTHKTCDPHAALDGGPGGYAGVLPVYCFRFRSSFHRQGGIAGRYPPGSWRRGNDCRNTISRAPDNPDWRLL